MPTFALRVKGIEQATLDGIWDDVPSIVEYPAAGLSAMSKRFEALAKTADAMAKPEEQESAKTELAQLSVRKKVVANRETLLAHIKKLQQKNMLEKCQSAVNTRNITIKQSQLMEQALTKELESALVNELKNLGVDHIPLSLKKSGSVGATFHQLRFPGSDTGSINLSDVLSDGEHRVVAIASFLGELNTSSHKCGIIFDDPVCSLDHCWREIVAKRLIGEGNNRQVIIFTHDIVFLTALREEAGGQKVPLTIQTVRRTRAESGLCDPDLPWIAKGVKDRLKYMKQHQVELSELFAANESELYKTKVRHFYGLLRDIWERTIEEVLLNDAIQRFRPSIETKRLMGVMITDEDYKILDYGMSRCSKIMFGHDRAAAAGETVIPPDDLLTDVTELEAFVNDIRKRSKDIRDKRK